jgi:hypothetical protein
MRNDICEDIASLFPLNLQGEVVALRGCIDASVRNNGVFSVAAVAYGFDRAVKANREWERLLDGRTLHMTDLHARQGDFAGLSKEDVTQIHHGVVRIVRENASYVMATSCDKNLLDGRMPDAAGLTIDSQELLHAFRSVYGLMCHLSMTAIGSRANEIKPGSNRQISYVFEEGDNGQAGFIRFIDFLQGNPGREIFLNGYSLNRYTVSSKENMEGIFHSADLVAWEWAKTVEGRKAGRKNRKSLEHLSNKVLVDDATYDGISLSNGKNVFFRHFGVDQINRAVDFWRSTIAATTIQEVNDAFSLWRKGR